MLRAIPVLFFAAITLGMLLGHGGEWEFNSHWIPVGALSPDGQTYRNGHEIDPITLAIIRSGNEETIMACIFGCVFLALAFLAQQLWSSSRSRKRFQRIGDLRDVAAQLRREGKFQEAEQALDRGEKLLDREIERLTGRGLWKCGPGGPAGSKETTSSHC